MNGSLRDLAAKWRVDEERPFISRHEYDSLTDPFSPAGDTVEMGPVGPVGPPRNINDLEDQTRTHLSGSNGGSSLPAGELSSWIAEGHQRPSAEPLPNLPGVPAEWTVGVYRLQSMRPPADVEDRRWAQFRLDALRLLHEQGAALHAAGWDEVDVFGLHPLAPDRRTDGMGLAWLVRNSAVVTIAGDAVSIKFDDEVVQRVFRRSGKAKLSSVPAWVLSEQDAIAPASS